MIVSKVHMSVSVLLVLTAGVSGHMPDRFMDEPHMMTRNSSFTRSVMCGRPRKNIYDRSALGASRTYMGDMPDLDNNVNDVPHLNEPVSDVPDMDTYVNDVSNPGRYVFDVPNLYTSVVDKLNSDTYMDDEPMMDKNTSDEPETDELFSDDSDLDKIIGGRYATRTEVPWQANIQTYVGGWHSSCGGSIINEFWILTSAHCLVDTREDQYRVVVGDYFQSRTDPEEQTLAVEKRIPHEKYKYGYNDIGLIKIKPQSNGRGILFGEYVQPICLPIGDSTLRLGTGLMFTGWGKTDASSGVSDILKLTILPLIDIKKCPYGKLSSEVFCAGENHGSSEACTGDSGGAAVYKHEGIYIQYGVASSSHGCALPNYPTIFTNVSFHVSWILQTIKNNSLSIDQESLPDRPHPIP